MKKLSFAAFAAILALVLTACDQVTATTGSTPAATPSVHGSVVLSVTSGNLPAGAQIRVAITSNIPKAISRATTVAQGDFHRDIPVSAAGTVNYSVTGVPDGSYGIAVTLMDSNSSAIGFTSNQTIQVTGGACAVPDFSITFGPSPE